MHVHGYAALKKGGAMQPVQFDRKPLSAGEVAIDSTHCGVCHSDLHQVNDDWKNSLYPCLPGHEIVGTVREVGEGVTKYKAGDRVGVGCMVNSCQQCDYCKAGEEQYCSGPKSCTLTYNGPKVPDGTNSYGGYSNGIIVREEFVLSIPEAISSEEAAPILCAGVTTYQPMKHFKVKAGDTVGVAGIGGLGHMAIQTAKALGATVVALSTSPEKAEEAEKLGASKLIDMGDKKAVEEAKQSLDFLISTIPYPHDLNPYVGMMKTDSTIAVVGNLIEFPTIESGPLVMNRIRIAGSLIGGVADTQEILDFAAEKGIRPEIELIDIATIDDAFKRMKDEDVRFRHVIDMATIKTDGEAEAIATPERGEVVG
ncbi:NAD(P)-dependent alcohol dehydrogenase [Sphingomonas sp. ASV193]|uniref:NAD(P)-dependent alcohol dehydrogenase n=1 Tax=Sphingomonas sp. ASV193 TaxID=3144405 RepID=UPI0032E90438